MYLPHIAMGRDIIAQLHNTKSSQIKFKIIESARFASLGGFESLKGRRILLFCLCVAESRADFALCVGDSGSL